VSIVLAVLESGGSAKAVLDTAIGIGELTDARVEAVHPPGSTSFEKRVAVLSRRAGVPLRQLDTAEGDDLLAAVRQADVVAAVVGARSRGAGRYPVGPLVRHLLERTEKPIVVVRADHPARPVLRRLLVPLEGTAASSQPVLERLTNLLSNGVELVVLHVFTEDTLPAMLDRPARDIEILGKEFLHRHLPHAHHIEMRQGSVPSIVAEVSGQQDSDLIVLSWSQDASPGRAEVIREVLTSSPVPVLLLPAAPPTPRAANNASSDEDVAV
jgi:hypothetical protein